MCAGKSHRNRGNIFRPLKGREGRLAGGCGRRPCSPSSFHSAPLGAPPFRLQHHDTKVSGDFSFHSLFPRTCFSSCLPAENSLLVFFLNLIFSGSEPRSKEEILSSLLGIIPRISHWKCIHNYQSYFFQKVIRTLLSSFLPSLLQACGGAGRGESSRVPLGLQTDQHRTLDKAGGLAHSLAMRIFHVSVRNTNNTFKAINATELPSGSYSLSNLF